jgi:hypothetical protein
MNWINGECYYNAYANREELEKLFKRKFYVRIGGLGLSGFYEFGHENPTNKNYASSPTDSHAWLETADGFIVDYAFSHYAMVCKVRGLPIKFPINKMVCGTREMLKKKYGLEYAPASMKHQENILRYVSKTYEDRFYYGILPRIEMSPKLIEFY